MLGSPFRLPRRTPFGIGESFVEWLTGLSKLDGHYQRKPKDPTSFEFMNYTLSTLGIDYNLERGNIEDIPKEGPLVIVANHPLGAIEGVILADFIGRARKDVKVLANELLKRLPEIEELFIGIDVFNGKNARTTNAKGVREAHQHLSNGGVLIVFPAGEVSTYSKSSNMLSDIEWSNSVAKFVKRSQATTLPIFVNGKNSRLFYQAGRIHPLLRTALLGRELLNKSDKTIRISLGSPMLYNEIKNFETDKDIVNYFRLNTYLMSSSGSERSTPDANYQTPIIQPINAQELEAELATLPESALLLEHKEFSVYCVGTQSIPSMMQEIARVREESFREVGEGSGLACDLDEYDLHYQQLFVWHRDNKELVGSYRLGLVDQLIEQNGIEGQYSRSLFQYEQEFIDTLENCIEVGRSVVAKKYQRNINSLLLLWKGIATYVYNNPKYTHLFGPVSISNEYSDVARHLMAATLSIHHYDDYKASLVKPSTPLRTTGNTFWQSNLLWVQILWND